MVSFYHLKQTKKELGFIWQVDYTQKMINLIQKHLQMNEIKLIRVW